MPQDRLATFPNVMEPRFEPCELGDILLGFTDLLYSIHRSALEGLPNTQRIGATT